MVPELDGVTADVSSKWRGLEEEMREAYLDDLRAIQDAEAKESRSVEEKTDGFVLYVEETRYVRLVYQISYVY